MKGSPTEDRVEAPNRPTFSSSLGGGWRKHESIGGFGEAQFLPCAPSLSRTEAARHRENKPLPQESVNDIVWGILCRNRQQGFSVAMHDTAGVRVNWGILLRPISCAIAGKTGPRRGNLRVRVMSVLRLLPSSFLGGRAFTDLWLNSPASGVPIVALRGSIFLVLRGLGVTPSIPRPGRSRGRGLAILGLLDMYGRVFVRGLWRREDSVKQRLVVNAVFFYRGLPEVPGLGNPRQLKGGRYKFAGSFPKIHRRVSGGEQVFSQEKSVKRAVPISLDGDRVQPGGFSVEAMKMLELSSAIQEGVLGMLGFAEPHGLVGGSEQSPVAEFGSVIIRRATPGGASHKMRFSKRGIRQASISYLAGEMDLPQTNVYKDI